MQSAPLKGLIYNLTLLVEYKVIKVFTRYPYIKQAVSSKKTMAWDTDGYL